MSKTVLIVDDNKLERTILRGLLGGEYEVIEAGSGAEALSILGEKAESVSAVVLDIIMPGMDGYETLKQIKENEAWRQIPVIIATALDDEEAKEKAVAYGADNFVSKPFNHKLLHYVLQNAIRLCETAAMVNALRYDKMTGLLNRDAFFSEATQLIQSHCSGYYVLSCLNIENFKVTNDLYGLEKGSEVLRSIATALRDFVADLGGISCHYFADEFIVLFPSAYMDSEAVRNNHDVVMSPGCIPQKIRVRIGRYVVDDPSLSINTMYDRASMAEASVKGKYDTYLAVYSDKMRGNLLEEQKIINSMDDALQNGEFVSWFQPQYNHATGALIGAEVLVRWIKDGKIIPPYRFVPVFEKNGFIYEIDKAIWRQACVCLKRWTEEGRTPPPVSVNISRYDLYQPDFLPVICGLVREFDLPAELLRLEITESAFSESSATITYMANELIRNGFTLEIDDFGSGYSSLNTLKDVPASILKLDMRFFENTENAKRSGNIVESVVRMAKWLGMAVIAEGVEQKEQADYLKSIGCNYIQGYLYARPMQIGEYEKCMAAGNKELKLNKLQTLSSLDNNEFWNPQSIDTLIFNSYAGAACILEYSKGKN